MRRYGRSFGLKNSTFGADTYGHTVKAFGNTTGKHFRWNPDINTFEIVGALSLDGTALTATIAELNRVADASSRIVNETGATLAITEALHDRKIITLNKADGQAVTLPPATGSGSSYKFILGTTVTSVGTTIKVTGNDTMTGIAVVANDGCDSASAFETASNSDTITLNGTTTGGVKGDMVELIDIATDLYWVSIRSSATSTEATPFSATV
jgi:hypothetical protein